jgi:hypothetical protein
LKGIALTQNRSDFFAQTILVQDMISYNGMIIESRRGHISGSLWNSLPWLFQRNEFEEAYRNHAKEIGE